MEWERGNIMDMKNWIINISIITVILFLIQIWKKYIFDILAVSLHNHKFDVYFTNLNSLPCKCLFPHFNRLYMQLNAYLILRNKQKIDETVDDLLTLRLTKKQIIQTYIKCFYYYIDEGDEPYSKKILIKINDIDEKNISQQCNQVYDIFIKKESKYISCMEKQLNLCKDSNTKVMLHYLIGLQYGYLKNSKKQKEHLIFVSEAERNALFK